MMNLSHDDCAWHSYVTWYNEAQKAIAFPCANVYLKCSASKCLERIGVRNRDAEIGVTLEYLQDVEKIHEQWLLDSSDVLVVDTNADGDDVIKRTADAVFEKIRTMCPIIGAGEA
eukprot:gene30003-18075_t